MARDTFSSSVARGLFSLFLAVSVAGVNGAEPAVASASHRVFTSSGASVDGTFFPIAVWLQSPHNAARYRAAGINLYIGLWNGPDAKQLAALEKAGMPVICDQNAFALSQVENPIIAGWMHGDEPDNAQSLGKGKGYGPPITTQKIVEDYQRIHAADPSRPVILNLGQGVAWDNYIGRGVRRNHPEDYAEYLRGCDIASFDIYPVVHDAPEVAGRLEFVPRGVERLIRWSDGKKPIWNCIECTHIGEPSRKATPGQVRSEVWMSLIRGSRGIIYFSHQFKPVFREAALLDDPEMLAGITALNHQIQTLAPVLNSPTVGDAVEVHAEKSGASIITMVKHRAGETWLFSANLENTPNRVAFSFRDAPSATRAEVLDEGRTISLEKDGFTEDFPAYGVHLYHFAK